MSKKKKRLHQLQPSLDHFLLRFWALLLLLVRSVDSFDHAAVANWFILLLNTLPPNRKVLSLSATQLDLHPGLWTARRWENTWDFLTTGNRTPGLVSATWIFMWISRQLWSSKNDLGHLMTRSLIVNPSVLPGRAVLCLEAAWRPLVCLSPQTGVRKVTCCVDSFFFKNKKSIYLTEPDLSCSTSGIFNCGRSLSCSTWYLVPRPGIKLWFPALRVWSSSHWTTREVSVSSTLVGKHTFFFFF